MRKLTNEEVQLKLKQLREDGMDVFTDDEYINLKTKMNFHCSKGHVWLTYPSSILYNPHTQCPYCGGYKAIVGETDLCTTHPEVAKQLQNFEDGRNIKINSDKKLNFVCKNCGNVVLARPAYVSEYGVPCNMCSDNISYPNKFMRSALQQVGVEFIPEYQFGDKKFFYDFYLPTYNCCIEMNGMQHYVGWNGQNNRLIQQQDRDEEKYKYAVSNGIEKYIVIDSRFSKKEYIVSNIIESELVQFIDLEKIDWNKCNESATKSMVVETAELYKQGKSIKEMMEIQNLSYTCIYKNLHRANENGWIDWYDRRFDPIILINTGEIFNSSIKASEKYDVYDRGIRRTCSHKQSYAGIDELTGMPLVWRRLSDYDKNEFIDWDLIKKTAEIRNNCNNTKL